MAIYQDLIDTALGDAGCTAVGETPTTAERNHALAHLNRILSSWSTEGVTCTTQVHESFTLSQGQQRYTFYAGGSFNSARPVAIKSALAISGAFQQPMEVLPYSEAVAKAQNPTGRQDALPTIIGYDQAFPQMNIFIAPPPSGSTSITVDSYKPMTAVALADTITVAPGWEQALLYALVVVLAPAYELITAAQLEALVGLANAYKAALVAPHLSNQQPQQGQAA